jgi:hypothetical protein
MSIHHPAQPSRGPTEDAVRSKLARLQSAKIRLQSPKHSVVGGRPDDVQQFAMKSAFDSINDALLELAQAVDGLRRDTG